MEVEINLKGEIKKIAVNEPKTKHQKEYLTILLSIEKEPKKITELVDYRDKLVMELTGLTQEDINEMDLVEKNKIIEKIESRMALFRGDSNFLLNSPK